MTARSAAGGPRAFAAPAARRPPSRRRVGWFVAVAALDLAAPVARAEPAGADQPAVSVSSSSSTSSTTSDPCALPADQRAPDPRCGESLDGRAPAEPSTARRVGQVALAVPRVATQAVFWPVVSTVDFLEYHKVVDHVRAFLTTDDGLVGVRPELQYSTSFLPTGGLRFFYRRLPGPGSEIMTRFRTAGPQAFLGQVGLRGPDALGLSLLATWDRRNDRLFSGIGSRNAAQLATADQGAARYGSDNLSAELRWSRRLPARLFAQAHSDLQRRTYQTADVRGGPSVAELYGLPATDCAALGLPAPCVDEAQVPGFGGGLRIAHLGGGLGLDLREPGRRGRGASVAVDGTLARGLAGDPSRHARLAGEAVTSVGGVDHQLLLRARAAMVAQMGSAPIPFDELVMPTGQDEMRGFASGRFRGPSGLSGTAEYRWYISAFLDATLFVDVGTVAGPHFTGLDGSRWFPSFGLGFRYYWIDGSYWEARTKEGIQIAYAPEGGWRFLFNMASF